MENREDITSLSKPFAHRLHAMISAQVITHRELTAWADALILKLDLPPVWLLNLTLTTDRVAAAENLLDYVSSEPVCDDLQWGDWADDCIASNFIRHERREISWEMFLQQAALDVEEYDGRNESSYFWELYSMFKRNGDREKVERKQSAVVEREYRDVIQSVRGACQALIAAGRTTVS